MQSLHFDTLQPQLPPVWPESLLGQIRQFRKGNPATYVILDDDPTGNQCSAQLPVLTSWLPEWVKQELAQGTEQVFVLTNSRSKTEEVVREQYTQIGKELTHLARATPRKLIPITRGDSTLRGHYLLEMASLVQGLAIEPDFHFIIPAFIEGERYTYQGIHYYLEDGQLIPVGKSPYAADPAFGYHASHLQDWIFEKSQGHILPEQIGHLSLYDIRTEGPVFIAKKILASSQTIWTADAMAYRDLEVIAMALCYIESRQKTFSIRTAASLLPCLIGKPPARMLERSILEQDHGSTGGLVVVGSVVSRTTQQLAHLSTHVPHQAIEIPVTALLASPEEWIQALANQVDQALMSKQLVVLYTSRAWLRSEDEQANLRQNQLLSGYLVEIIQRLSVRPQFMVAKGGITASDLATKSLHIRRAWVEGPLLPGVPLWRADAQAKWPNIPYLVFPGNVGSTSSLTEAVKRLASHSSIPQNR